MKSQTSPVRFGAVVAVYLLAQLGLGTALVFGTTPLTTPDASLHFRRAVEISEGGLLARPFGPNDWGADLDMRSADFADWLDHRRNFGPVATKQSVKTLSRRLAAAPDGRRPASFPSTASFAPLPYLPAAAGLAVARTLSEAPLPAYRLGALASLLSSVILTAIIVAVLPFGRVAVLALLTTPVCLALAAGYSADPVTSEVSLLFVALVLRLRAAPARPLPRAALFGLPVAALCLGLLKLTSAVVAVAIVLVPGRRFAARRHAAGFRLAVMAVAVGAALAWNLAYPFVPARYWNSGGDPSAELRLVAARPLAAIAILLDNLREAGSSWWITAYSAFGGGPSPYLFVRAGWTTGAALLLIALAAAAGGPRARMGAVRQAAILATIAVAAVAVLLLAFMIAYSPPGAAFIAGVQGRYFIVPLCLLALSIASLLPHPPRSAEIAAALLTAILALEADTIRHLLATYRPLWH